MPDSASWIRDGASGLSDAALNVADAALNAADAPTGFPDGASGLPDAASGVTDAPTGFPDGASGLPDAASGLRDAVSGLPDAASGLRDAGSGLTDAATGLPDATSSLPDSAMSFADAMLSLPDATVDWPDADAPPGPDAASTPHDADAPPAPDAALPPTCHGAGPGAFEACDGRDDDCDGVVDEGCELPLHGLEWRPLRRLPGLDGACPAGLVVRGAATCAPDALTLPPAPLADWFRFRQAPGTGAGAHLALALPAPVPDFRVRLRLVVEAVSPQAAPGSAFAYVGLLFDDEAPAGGFPGSIAGLTFPPGELPRFYHRGMPSSGGGRRAVTPGETLDLSVERVGALLVTRVDGVYAGHTQSPGVRADGADGPHGALTGLVLACVDCTARVDTLVLEVPDVEGGVEPSPATETPCDDRIRNGDFEAGLAFFSVVPPEVRDGPCCASPTAAMTRDAYAAVEVADGVLQLASGPAGQPAPALRHPLPALPPGAAVLSFVASAPVPSTLDVSLAGCAPAVTTVALDEFPRRVAVEVDCGAGGAGHVELSVPALSAPILIDDLALRPAGPDADLDCTPWRDRPAASAPVFRLREVAPVFEIEAERSAPWSTAGADATLRLTTVGEDTVLTVTLAGRPALPAGYALTFGPADGPAGVEWRSSEAVVCPGCGPGGADTATFELVRPPAHAATPETYAIALSTADGAIDRLRVRLPPAALAPPPAYVADAVPAWAERVRTFTLHPRRLGPGLGDVPGADHFVRFRSLGLTAVGLVNPHQNEMPAFVAAAGAVGLPVDLQMFQAPPFWRDDADRDVYRAWARGAAAARAACPDCPPTHLTLMDEPDVRLLALCTRDLSTRAPAGLRADLSAAADATGCALPCDGAHARAACLAGLPAEIDALAAEVRALAGPDVLLGVNLTGDGGLSLLAGLGESLDTLSLTDNGFAPDFPWRWQTGALERRVSEAAQIALAAYGQIAGPAAGFYTRGAPPPGAYMGHALWQVAAGAVMLRDFVWPAQSLEMLDEMAATGELFAALAPTVPRGRLSPRPPTDHPDLAARAFRDAERTVLIVANVSGATRTGRVDVRGLLPDGDGIERGVLRAVFAPFEGRVFVGPPLP